MCLSLCITAWLPWNCPGCAFMQQNPAPGCLRCARLLKNGFAAIRGTPVSQVTTALIKLKFQWAEFQHGRASQMPESQQVGIAPTAAWSTIWAGILPEPGRAGVICIHLHMWQPLLQLLYRQEKALFTPFQKNSLVEGAMGAADPESTKKNNLKFYNNFIQSQNQSQCFRSLSPTSNPAAPPLKPCP